LWYLVCGLFIGLNLLAMLLSYRAGLDHLIEGFIASMMFCCVAVFAYGRAKVAEFHALHNARFHEAHVTILLRSKSLTSQFHVGRDPALDERAIQRRLRDIYGIPVQVNLQQTLSRSGLQRRKGAVA
jgi:hypothetical protein